MSTSREQRVDDALSQLVERLVPLEADEDEAAADRRYDEALEFARAGMDSTPALPAADVNHVSDLVKRRLVRENAGPERALRFSNLFSRLLAQPVLGRKWAILWFLYRVAGEEGGGSLGGDGVEVGGSGRDGGGSGSREDDGVRGGGVLGDGMQEGGSGGVQERGFEVDSPAFNEAFSKNGLPRLPRGEEVVTTTRAAAAARRGQGLRNRAEAGETNSRSSQAPEPEPSATKGGPMEPSEAALLRDLPFTLQGLSSTNLVFTDKTSLKLPPTLPIPLISLLHTLAEPSLLYRGLADFVESSEGGLIGQSLRAAIGLELRAYLGLVATLEGQIRRALTQLDNSLPRQGLGKAGVTLKRCVIWMREATMGLRLMSLMVDESRGKKGGELISLIHSFASSHGDPFVYTFAERLLAHVTKPFYSMLRQWIYDGELEDPYLEFLVSENANASDPDADPRRGGATSVWEDKYTLNEAMIPSIMTADFAEKVYLIGKSLNFIRYGCGDSAWVEHHSKDASRELSYGDTANLETSIDKAYKTTMARLIHLMSDKFKLFEHLAALKKYLLLGQGDFIALLMESLASNLDRPANSQYRHTLTAQLEHAIRNSNAQHDSADVLRRLDARMLELSHGEIGWDVFTLEYRIDSPLDVVVTPYASKQYLKVFNFLWRVKRVEFAL
ncbi:Microtubule-nucleating Tub4p (gamma-tubulin) complex component, partial [Elasticomyces elasticus]